MTQGITSDVRTASAPTETPARVPARTEASLLSTTYPDDWRLRALAVTQAVCLFDWDIRADNVYADANLAEFFGFTIEEAEAGMSAERWIGVIDEADRARVAAAVDEAVRTGEPYQEEYTLHSKARGPIRVVARGQCLNDEDGPCRFPGSVFDVTDRWRTQQAEADANRNFRVILDAMPQMLFLTSPSGQNEYFNARCYEVAGMRPGELTTERWQQLIHPADRQTVIEGWKNALAAGRPWATQYRALDRQGLYRWLLVQAEPLRDSEGRIERWLGTATDVDDMKRVEADKERLTEELNHRVRNNMAVIQALALQAFPDAGAQPRTKFVGRIQAISRVHEVLTERSWRRTRLRDVIEAALTGCAATERVDIFGPPVTIEPKQAVAVGLAAHELCLNAVTHGALSAPGGEVTVRWSVEECKAGGEPMLHLLWIEKNGPAVPRPPRRGLGRHLIEGSLAAEFSGEASVDFRPEGIVFSFTAPLP